MSGTATKSDVLRSAFDAFNQHSSRLEASYRHLRSRVDELTRQLEHAQSARHRELVEKERLGNRLARTLEALPGAVIVLDGDGIVRERNTKAAELLNRPLTGLAWSDIVRRECAPRAFAPSGFAPSAFAPSAFAPSAFAPSAFAPSAFAPSAVLSGDLCLNDGRSLSLSRRSLGDEPGEILLLADVTESRRTTELLERQQRLSCLGEMTATLAHQIRTPLASALLNAARLSGDGEQAVLVGRIRDRLNEIGRMVEDMLRFVSGARRSEETFSVASLLAELVETCDPGLTVGDLDVALVSDDIVVAGNRDAIKAALTNLIDNARQACGDDPRIELGAECSKDSVFLTVSDNGHGIAHEARARLFEPFFTTRPQGTGLGLAVVRAVAEAHGGEVLVESGAHGSTFALRLPATEPAK